MQYELSRLASRRAEPITQLPLTNCSTQGGHHIAVIALLQARLQRVVSYWQIVLLVARSLPCLEQNSSLRRSCFRFSNVQRKEDWATQQGVVATGWWMCGKWASTRDMGARGRQSLVLPNYSMQC